MEPVDPKELFLRTAVCVTVPTCIRRSTAFDSTGSTNLGTFEALLLRFEGSSFAVSENIPRRLGELHEIGEEYYTGFCRDFIGFSGIYDSCLY